MNANERKEHISRSPHKGRYDKTVDRESAYEMLVERAKLAVEAQAHDEVKQTKPTPRRSNRQSPTEAFVKSAARAIGSQLGRRVIRGILGSLFKS